MGNKERSLFSKLVGSLVLLLLPVLILSVYSSRVNESVITGQIKQSGISRLSTLATQLDSIITQLETFTYLLIRDPNVIEFQDLSLLNSSYYEQISRKSSFRISCICKAPRRNGSMKSRSIRRVQGRPYLRSTEPPMIWSVFSG